MSMLTIPHHTNQLTQTLLKSVVKNCLQFEILPYLQANELACHGFMESSRRHKILWLEVKVYYLQQYQ